MSMIFDVIVLAVIILTVFLAFKRGFVRTVMGLISAVLVFFAAIFFTPYVSEIVYNNIILPELASGIGTTLESSLSTTGDIVDSVDLDNLAPGLEDLLEKFGFETESLNDKIDSLGEEATIEKLSEEIASPIASSISVAATFIALYIIFTIILEIIMVIIGGVVNLPMLRSLDSVLGLVLGVILAVIYAIIISNALVLLSDSLSAMYSSVFPENIADSTVLVGFFSGLEVSQLTDLVARLTEQ
ncbi:MAG: CvpA family protein [Firmicutes bacterium]|nr:CvpA family protein [Bacillota bacterium]